MRTMNSFADFMQELEAEAQAEGPEAIVQLEQLRHRFRLGGELAMRRKEAGWTQRRLADATGIDQSEISRIERAIGNPTEDTLALIAKALGMRLSFVPYQDALQESSRPRRTSSCPAHEAPLGPAG